MMFKPWLLLFLIALYPSGSQAQTFTETNSLFEGVIGAAAAWGDYDNDGDLDLIVVGDTTQTSSGRVALLYQNHDSAFLLVQTQIMGVEDGSVDWGDYDNDGDLDLLMTGLKDATQGVTKVYRNDMGTFHDIGGSLVGVYSGGGEWGDIDNDGDLDFLISGITLPQGPVTRIYRNDGSNTFNEIVAELPGVFLGHATWADYDNDLDLDVLVTGETDAGSRITEIFRNDDGAFVATTAGLQPLQDSFAAWGDFDNDSDFDLALIGSPDVSSRFTMIYRKDPGPTPYIAIAALQAVSNGSLAWGDFNHDHLPDLLLSGYTQGGTSVTRVYVNNRDSFTSDGSALSGVNAGSAVWGDFDNDLNLDIFVAGSGVAKLYRNQSPMISTTPPTLDGLFQLVSERDVTLLWSHPQSEDSTGLLFTYNVRVGTQPGKGDVLSPMSDSSGTRLIPRIGNAGANPSKILKNLPEGTYFWSVQAVNNGFVGSAFAAEQSFTIVPDTTGSPNEPPRVVSHIPSQLLVVGRDIFRRNLIVSPAIFSDPDLDPLSFSVSSTDSGVAVASLEEVVLEVVTVDTGMADIIVRAHDNRGGVAQLAFAVTVVPLPDTTLFKQVAHPIPPLERGSVAWGDYDNDGDLDILVSGSDFPNNIAAIFRNDNGEFDDIDAGLLGVTSGSAAWGDYDNDGDLDIVLSGSSVLGNISRVYRNDGGVFTDIQAGLVGVQSSSVAWGDYDNDGDLDLALAGVASGAVRTTEIYRNDLGMFMRVAMPLPAVSFGSIAWGDYDNDSDLDILLTGNAGADYITKIFRNEDGEFVDAQAPLIGAFFSSAAWGDYDNDGDLDILLTGKSDSGPISKVYRNDQGIFVDTLANLEPVKGGGTVWGDYDNDGDLDILMTGYNEVDSTYAARVYENYENSFVDVGFQLVGVEDSAIAWGDYDNDNDLDFLLTGINFEFGHMTKLYRNQLELPNAEPDAPANLRSIIAGDSLVLGWDQAADDLTQPAALTYNLRVGTTPGGQEIVTPMSELSTGFRLQPQIGNVNHNTTWVIKRIPNLTLYWSVQAIDNGFAGSPFATEQMLPTGVVAENEDIPDEFQLSQNFPNPFNPNTLISYTIPRQLSHKHIALEIYNARGQKIRTLLNAPQPSGHYRVAWNAVNDRGLLVSAGLYFCRLRVGAATQTRKMVLIR